MANRDDERRMVFDLRGRRRGVVKFIYATLALLMAGGLILFGIGGEVSGGLFEGLGIGGDGSNDASQVFDEQVERIEGRLAKNPKDEALLLSLARARLNGANALVEVDEATGSQTVTPEARVKFEQAEKAWDRYLKQAGDEINPSLAQLAAGAFFTLALNATSYDEAFEDLDEAASAQRVVAEERPSIGSYTTLAYYEYLGGHFAAGAKATKQAERLTNSKAQRKTIARQTASFRKQGKEIQKQKREIAKAEKGKGKETLENPFGGLGGSSVP